MEQKNKFIYILPVMFGFFIMGFCDLVGISVTYAKEQFQWTETQAGFLPSMVFLWFFYLVCTYSHVNEPDRTKKYSIIEYAVHFRRHGIAFH